MRYPKVKVKIMGSAPSVHHPLSTPSKSLKYYDLKEEILLPCLFVVFNPNGNCGKKIVSKNSLH
jgi:hypothetical protein